MISFFWNLGAAAEFLVEPTHPLFLHLANEAVEDSFLNNFQRT